MKKLFLALFLCFTMTACSSGAPTVQRVDSSEVIDLSGKWNDTDVRQVARTLIDDCTNSGAIARYTSQHKKPPLVIVGRIKNESSEHIDTSILSKQFEVALVNSGVVETVASSDERGALRAERNDQQTNASMESASALANETGANFMLIGSIKTIVDSNGKDQVRTYFVSAELIDIETNRKLWMGENSDIKKVISRSNVRR